MKTVKARLLGAVVVLALLMTMLLVGPAQAHVSTYCGHGFSGYLKYTQFRSHWNLGYVHMHKYDHYNYHQADGLEYLHTEQRSCP